MGSSGIKGLTRKNMLIRAVETKARKMNLVGAIDVLDMKVKIAHKNNKVKFPERDENKSVDMDIANKGF